MDLRVQAVLDLLDSMDAEYEVTEHPVFLTCDDANAWGTWDAIATKNLFLRDKKTGNRYLAVLEDKDRLDLKAGRETAGWSNRTTFCGDDDLLEYLGVEPGACGVFGLMNDREHRVVLALAPSVAAAGDDEKIIFPGNVNTVTISLRMGDVRRFVRAQGNPVVFL